jgi:beta-glucosidase
VGQIPIYYNHKSTGRPADAANRYTSKYLDAPVTPLFRFGFGLSYSQFKLSNLRLSGATIRPDGRVTVSVDVENIGKYSGDEVVQLYIKHVAASVTPPIKELRGFQRISLRPGEKRLVKFTLDRELLGFYNREMRFVVEPGNVRAFVGTSSEGGLESVFEIVAR